VVELLDTKPDAIGLMAITTPFICIAYGRGFHLQKKTATLVELMPACRRVQMFFGVHMKQANLKPRNPIIQAAVLGMTKMGTTRHRMKTKSGRQQSGRDMNQMARECRERC
jgi:hypothetical protein